MMNRRQWLVCWLPVCLAVALLSGAAVAADKFPQKPITIICTFGAGGTADLTSRIWADYLKKEWRIPVTVVNVTGGATVPAVQELYHAQPDGYTVMNDSNSSSSMLPIAVKDIPFNVMERTYIASLTYFPQVFVVPAASPIKTLKDLEAEAKRSPDDFTWTSLGGTGGQDYTARQFFKAIGVDVYRTKPISGKSGTDAARLTAGGNVKMGLTAPSSGLPSIQGGLIRPLAIAGKERFHALPEVPTTIELGYPSIVAVQWNGISAPAKLPPDVIDAWEKALQKMNKDPEVIEKLKKIGVSTLYLNAKETREYVAKEMMEVKSLWGVQ
jgi:tripartite-type tricarboxylate transporter receptor subunit TctC